MLLYETCPFVLNQRHDSGRLREVLITRLLPGKFWLGSYCRFTRDGAHGGSTVRQALHSVCFYVRKTVKTEQHFVDLVYLNIRTIY